MKNLTLRIQDPTLRKARRIAAERSTSVNALIREYLDALVAREDRQTRARAELLGLCRASRARVGGKTWAREDLHER